MAESLCCPPETITTLLISYTPIQNKKLNFLKNSIGSHKKKESKISAYLHSKISDFY